MVASVETSTGESASDSVSSGVSAFRTLLFRPVSLAEVSRILKGWFSRMCCGPARFGWALAAATFGFPQIVPVEDLS